MIVIEMKMQYERALRFRTISRHFPPLRGTLLTATAIKAPFLLTMTIMNPIVQITTVFHMNCIIATNEKSWSMLLDRNMIR